MDNDKYKYKKYKYKYFKLLGSSSIDSKKIDISLIQNKLLGEKKKYSYIRDKDMDIEKEYLHWTTYNWITRKQTKLISLINKKGIKKYYITKPKSFYNRNLNNDNNIKYIIWIRHCHSCANELDKIGDFTKNITNLFKNIKKKVSREPLCTEKGMIQSVNMGYILNDFIYNNKKIFNPNINSIKFFSSYLPRTFETSKLIIDSFKQKNITNMKINNKIKRLCFINEEIKTYDLFFKEGSQSSTLLGKSNCHAKYINNIINQKKNKSNIIVDDGYPCSNKYNPYNLKQPINGQFKDDLPLEYFKFLNKYLENNNNILENNSINVIVSHGGYIRINVLQSSEYHPNNTQGYLVRYNIDKKEIDILNSIEGGNDTIHPDIPYPSSDQLFLECNYTFNQYKKNDTNSISYYGCPCGYDKNNCNE